MLQLSVECPGMHLFFPSTICRKKINKNIQGRKKYTSKDRTINSEDYFYKLHSAAGVIALEDKV